MPVAEHIPRQCGFVKSDTPPVPEFRLTCSGCRKNRQWVEIPEAGKPHILICTFCKQKMIVFGLGNRTGAYTAPLKGEPKQNPAFYARFDSDLVSDHFCIQIFDVLENCYPE